MQALTGLSGLSGIVGAGAFLPTQLSGLVLWLKADAGTFQASGGAAATADADPVGEWQDQSGQGNHPVQATAANRPTLRTNVQNGLSVVRFDGVNDFLQKSFTLNQPFTVLMAFSSVSAADDYLWDGITNDQGTLFHSNPAATLRPFAGSTGTGVAYTSGDFVTVEVVYNNASSAWTVNDAADTTGTLGTRDPGGLTLCARASGAFAAQADVGEFLVYNVALSRANRDLARAYLNGRWGAF